MKQIFSILLMAGIFLISKNSIGQKCELYGDLNVGTSTKMVYYEKKDKPSGYTITTLKEKNNIPGGEKVLFHQLYNNYDDYSFESEFSLSCVDGDIIIDMSKFIDPNSMTAYQDMDYDIQADNLTIPKNAAPGDELNDGSVSVTVNTGTPVKVNVTVTLSNRKVESKETIETPAGSFECLKITYDVLSQISFIKIKSSTAEYFNRKYGVVRTESYNKKGKLSSYSVLEEINN